MTRKDAEEFLEEIRKRMSDFNGPITAGGRMPADNTTPCPGCASTVSAPPTLCDACAKSEVLEDLMIAELLHAEVVFPAALDRAMITDGRRDLPVALYVHANDTFACACADAEVLTLDQVLSLYALWRCDPTYGPVAWVVRRRGKRPIRSVEMALRKRDLWNAEMEALL